MYPYKLQVQFENVSLQTTSSVWKKEKKKTT